MRQIGRIWRGFTWRAGVRLSIAFRGRHGRTTDGVRSCSPRARAGEKEFACAARAAVLEAARWNSVMDTHDPTRSADRPAQWRAQRPCAGAGRQVDFDPRAHSRRARRWARRGSAACLKARTCSTPRRLCATLGGRLERRGGGQWRVHGVGVAGFAEPAAKTRFRQFRHRLPAHARRGRGLSGHRDVRRRCELAQAADAARARSAWSGSARARCRRPTAGCR